MHRRHLNLLLQRYADRWPDEGDVTRRFVRFVERHDDCLLRSCVSGHVTTSAWILSPDADAALLTHHRKLGRWLQLGGHVDGDARIEQACLREAREESGMQRFTMVPWSGDELVPLDLDVHQIPARTDADGRVEPAHLHWDVRFLLRAAPGQRLQISAESNRLEWVDVDRLHEHTDEESVLRLHRKAVALGAVDTDGGAHGG